MKNKSNYDTIPVGQLGIIALPGCEELAAKIDHYLKTWRYERNSEHKKKYKELEEKEIRLKLHFQIEYLILLIR